MVTGPVHIPTVRPATDKLSWIRPFMTPLARWADDELRSTNAQVAFLLRHRAGRRRAAARACGTNAPLQAAACRQPGRSNPADAGR